MENNLKKNVYTHPIHFNVHLKLTQHCKSTILQFKNKKRITKQETVRFQPALNSFTTTSHLFYLTIFSITLHCAFIMMYF